MDPSKDFKSLQEKVQKALVSTTKSANRIANEDLSFQRTVNPDVAERLDEQTSRLLKLSGDLLESAAKATDQNAPSSFDDPEDVDIQWRAVVDVIDSLLERADTCLDEYTGLVKRKDAPTSADANPKRHKTNDRLDRNFRRANIIKPQNAFEHKPNNFETGPWKPILGTKPHATVPLDESLSTFIDEYDHLQYKHPYETEILNLEYPASVYQKKDAIPYLPVETTTAIWVDTYEGVLEMLEELKKAKEIAIDLEHHDFRTYTGLLSLMQISTREKDWIVDTLKPWRHRLEVLNEVFADPSIVKVFHGAFMDIVWLQRDLGLYIVGLFDTFHASGALGYPGRSLAYLLKKFVDFDADKKYQMADWRIRPLPEEMFYYARSDTHYLLYIYDKLRNELLEHSDRSDPEKDLIRTVLQKSKETSLLRYEAPLADPETGHGSRGWFNTLVKTPSLLKNEEFAVYRAVHKWRDDLARRDDENPAFVMPQQTLIEIARIMPSDQKALWSLLNNSSQSVKKSLDELFALIQEAKAQGANGPSMMDFFRGDTVGSLAKRLFAKKDEDPDAGLPSAKELKSEQSQLWGNVPLSSLWDASSSLLKEANGVQIAVPWSNFVQGATVDLGRDESTQEVEPKGMESDMLPLETKSAPKPADDEFTLRAGRKREHDEISQDPTSTPGPEAEAETPIQDDQDVITLKDDDEEKRRRKAERKKMKKEKKQEKKRQRLITDQAAPDGQSPGVGAAEDAEEEDQPFDYSTAESVLHAKKANGGETSKVFDPYVSKMTTEGPKAARRMHGEKPGKSHTFKK
ncbi:Exosome complex exonuclease rrp6 [Pleurostoma richardsiae]|uniref:Exosome complex exonuclease rrp6 n=1 Tax=Pleurostoma richardsiae TaxID=41990 RepID=A0AA38RH84_9PEZI|nr:Exosome complex exonuclease rrp6 [Pleurostoma richardsiae]